jgi:hypothetical protein
MSRPTTVITVDGRLSDVTLPLPVGRLLSMTNSAAGNAFNEEEEAALTAWLGRIAVSTLPCPIADERWLELSGGRRTTTSEDRMLAQWVLAIWEAIQGHLR